MNYTIAAKETMYDGIRYRSRLEARWAAFMKLAGWQFEYEPFDLHGWSPDFLIKAERRNILVEVKPITSLDYDVVKKICAAAAMGGFYDLLILGVGVPVGDCGIGWCNELGENEMHMPIDEMWDIAAPCTPGAGHRIGYCAEYESYKCRISGRYTGSFNSEIDLARRLWKSACEKTRFEITRRRN